MNLSEHFTLKELTVTTHKNIDNTAPPGVIDNLKRLANFLEKVRTLLKNKPIIITSGYRCKTLNDAVGSKDSSQHLIGCAADFHVEGMNIDKIINTIIDSDLEYDQVIREFGVGTLGWCHISIPSSQDQKPRRESLIIDSSGTRNYIPRKTNKISMDT